VSARRVVWLCERCAEMVYEPAAVSPPQQRHDLRSPEEMSFGAPTTTTVAGCPKCGQPVYALQTGEVA
jgi:hypothetical protein